MLETGTLAPDFTLPDQDGTEHTLSDYKGQWVLIYFYPKDDTPGCTAEACQLRDTFPNFEKVGVKILGVSADTVESHKKFADKHNLPFTILADPEKKMLNAYGVWQEKSMMGKAYMGVIRSSYLVDPKGMIAKVYPKVVPEMHAQEVLTDLGTLRTT